MTLVAKPATGAEVRARPARWHRAPLLVAALGIALAVVAVIASTTAYDDNESRLLSLEGRLTAATLLADPLYVDAHLGNAAAAAEGSRSPAADFRAAVAGVVGPKGAFSAASLWKLAGPRPELITAIGAPVLPTSSSELAGLLSKATSTTFAVERLTAPGKVSLGYAMAAAGRERYVAYAEEPLPANRRISEPKSSPIHQLNLAVYLGSSVRHGVLVETDAAFLPLSGRTVTRTIPFGDTALTLVMSPRGSLSGGLAPDVPWGVGAFVVLLGLGMAAAAERLIRRRQVAEHAAAASGQLLQTQREIAQTLQHSLLPETLPAIPGVEIVARYVAAAAGLDVGGDWYDVVQLAGDRLFFAVGDVSGHGLKAAALMGTLRNAVNAYGREGHGPSEVLNLLSPLVNVVDGQFATVLCGVVDLVAATLQIGSAGHLPPLLLRSHGNQLIAMATGTPIGVRADVAYDSVTVPLAEGDVLLAFTDGLVERRDEAVTDGLERLRAGASCQSSLDQLVDDALAASGAQQAMDDIAILAFRYHGVAHSKSAYGGDLAGKESASAALPGA